MSQAEQILLFHVAIPDHGEVAALEFVWTRQGEDRTVSLTDDGAVPGDIPWDGVWTGVDSGLAVGEVTGRLLVTDLEGVEHQAHWGTVAVTDVRSEVIAWQLIQTTSPDLPWQAKTVFAAWPGSGMLIPEATGVYIGAAWTGLCFVMAASLIHVSRRRGIGW